MGGNIFEQNKRATRLEYLNIIKHVQDTLNSRLGARSLSIPAYHEKVSFGDVDIIVEKEKICFPEDKDRFQQIKDIINEYFHSADFIQVNDSVISFLYKKSPQDQLGIQVDLLATPQHEMGIARDYFSYNDLGNLMGRIAHKMGLSFGHRGLLYVVRDGTHVLDTIVVSQQAQDILPFLGYDFKRFEEGFNNVNDIFEFVTSTPFFNKDLYLLENRNHTSRTRDRKRPNYRGFLEYIETHSLPYFAYPENKDVWIERLTQHFPAFPQQLQKVREKEIQKAQDKLIFNGEIVRNITGLDGESLGWVIKKFHSMFETKTELLDYVKANPQSWQNEVIKIANDLGSVSNPPKTKI